MAVVHILSLSEGRSVHALPSSLFKIHFNIIFSSTPRYSKWSLQVSLPKPSVQLSSLPHVPHASPLLIICVLIIVVRVGECNSLIDIHCTVKDCKTPVELVNSCTGWPSRHRFFLVSLCLQANVEMVPKFPSCYYMPLM